MRLVVLEVLAVVAALVFLTMLAATAMHRSSFGPEDTYRRSALVEYLWTLVPWLMMAACVLPAVRRIVAAP